MDSKLLVTLHLVAVNLFIVIYLIKIILLFVNPAKLDVFSKKIKVPEMIVSTLFLVTGIWLFAILGAIKSLQYIKLVLVAVSIPVAVMGFKKHHKSLAILAMLLIVSAYGISEAARNKPYNPGKVEITGDATGANVEGASGYLSNCAMCHGADGKKEYRGAAVLSLSKMDEGAAAMIISAGIKNGPRGNMPPFNGVLDDAQIKSIAAYIQGFKK